MMDGSINPPNPKQRYGDLKVPLGLVPSSAKVYAGLAFAEGAQKYGAYNWRDKAVEAMTYVHAAERHLAAWIDGEEIDPDSGAPHLGHALACLSILADAIEVGNLIDNRPLPAPTGDILREWADIKRAQETPGKLDEETLTTTFGPVEAYAPQEYPLTAPTDWWSSYEAWDRARQAGSEEYPFTSHRTMAEIMAEEAAACPLDGRNCDHEHPTEPRYGVPAFLQAHRRLNQEDAFGEGDETTWIAATEPEKPVPAPKWDSFDVPPGKRPCECDRGRCRVENGWNVGPRTFCCRGEAGR